MEDKEKMMEYQMLEQQLNTLGQNLENIENNLEEIRSIIQSLEEFKEVKKGDDILVPLANGIFAEATINNVKKLKVNVGSKVVLEKSIDETKKIMEDQISDLEEFREESEKYYMDMYNKMQEIAQQLNEQRSS